jgi:signal transduction histidine kinase
METRRISSWVGAIALLVSFTLAPMVFRNEYFQTSLGDLVPLLVVTATIILTVQNARASRGPACLFWWLTTVGMSMWWVNQASWVWFEVILRVPVPDPFFGDIVLFLHVVLLMAAVAIRPRETPTGEGMVGSAVNVVILLVWWVVVYAFLIFPDEYIILNSTLYSQNWDLLYLLEGLILVVLSGWAYLSTQGPWRPLFRTIFIASTIYSLASESMNMAIAKKTYVSGSAYDLPFLVSLLCFFAAALYGRRHIAELQTLPANAPASGTFTPYLTKVALLSLPLMGYWALYGSNSLPYLRHVRFAVAMGGVGALAFVVFLKQHLLDRKLVQLLNQSRQSLSSLQRLHGRVIQQEKLASLGELVALAASELDYPLSAILESSETLAASSNLRTEQLSTAQKIGQQARRTRDLITDLLSFAQQTPGEKVPLELKPLVQRAVQMESFKLEGRQITLSVQSEDPLPRVLGNSNQLLQAFLQVVENAVDALQEASGGRLLVSLWREDKEIVLEFADTGPGLRDPERVFDPFYTTKPVGKGTGLGLSATYGVIQDHKGQISCYNRPEGGAIFEIRLPVAKSGAIALAEAAAGI